MKYKLILLLLFLIPLAHAADTDTAMDWLAEQTQPTISGLSFSILAADAFRPSTASSLKTQLNTRKSTENCYPKGACSPKDTALALIALNQNPDTNTWLTNIRTPDTEGKWVLQIETDSTGTCTINYLTQNRQINVNQGRISSSLCSTPTTLFDLNTCLESHLVSAREEIEFSINCLNLINPVISAAYNLGNTFLPIGESSPSLSKIIKIKNTYFRDFESTLYTNLAFKQVNAEPPSIIWLKKSYNLDNIIQNALLSIITEDTSYIQQLITKQQETGSFGSLYETALAVYALRKANTEQASIALATTWLDSQQSPDGSWASSVEDTAAILFGAYAPISAAEPAPTTPTTQITEECKENGICEPEWGETAANCPADCRCGDTICDSSETSTSCPEDCAPAPVIEEEEEEGKGFFFWFILALFLVLIIVLIYFYYTKFYKKGRNLIAELKGIFTKVKKLPRKSIPKEITLPARTQLRSAAYPVRVTRKTKLESELAKSIAEAKKVLKK